MALTPMMNQYIQIKEKCQDCILFFRLGDFYEMFFDDAEIAAKELELVLTGRDCGLKKRAPMCGVPYHAANSYIGKLVGRGYKVAICEQIEDPSLAKGIVKRDIVKIITPGTYTDSNFLEEGKNNFIMSIFIDNQTDLCGLSFADISTGELYCTETKFNLSIIVDEISKFNPSEIIYQDTIDECVINTFKERFSVLYSCFENEFFMDNTENILREQFNNYNKELYTNELFYSVCGLFKYIIETQKSALSHIDSLEYYNIVDYLVIDSNSRRNLELTETIRNNSKKGSLLWVLDKTNTSMGARRLRKWVEQPLVKENKITERLSAVEELIHNIHYHEELKESLKNIYDIERIVGKISCKSVNARELITLKKSISKIPSIKYSLKEFNSDLIVSMNEKLDDLKDIFSLLEKSINENPPINMKEGNIIKQGFNDEIDKLREAKINGKNWISNLEKNEKELTGIKSLKVGYNKVFGYYIEVTKANLHLIPEDRYIRKQTLSNAERFIIPELKKMEEEILGAEDKLIKLEYEIFVSIRESIEKENDRMKKAAKIISELDCLSSLATVALENNYVKPEINENGVIEIKGGRHPVVEKVLKNNSFVENDTYIDNKDDQLLIITGPNMAGKSTYMRQVALITLMAQIGSFVPANTANISICDKIFTRIGASDDLAAGKSTFMVEMCEVANILKNATNRSLVLLDEVGRGTSTFDGLSIAWSIIEYMCNVPRIRCKTLFATHYHELIKLEGEIIGVKNYSIAVKNIDGEIVFLRKIVPGGADESYGIEVAKLAGLPNDVIKRAKDILVKLESTNDTANINCNTKENKTLLTDKKYDAMTTNEESKEYTAKESDSPKQLNILDISKDNLINEIKNIDILNLTLMDGFNKLYDIIKKANSI